ncbi:MAG: hypothetical protein NWF06_07535 [Candidatus Bathyarchaeota archaeon]|nr:hypothetical protein [Candidatus Bathyarchaeum sp.]
MWTITWRRFKRDKRGVSNVIVVALSLVIILAIVSDIVLWNYEMTQVDWEKMKENINITNVESVKKESEFTFENNGGLTVHLVSLWVITEKDHQQYDVSVFVNSAETKTYTSEDISLPAESYTIKVVTERGNIAVYSGN